MPETFLDYAPGQSLVTRIGRQRLIWITILAAVVVAAVIWTDPAIRRIKQWNARQQFLRLQRQCMSYTAPADRVIYEEDPVKAAALELNDASYEAIDTRGPQNLYDIRPEWQPPVRRKEAPLWSAYAAGPAPVSAEARTSAFLGERRTSSGERRLVCIEFAAAAGQSTDGGWTIGRWLRAWSFTPGSLDTADSHPLGHMVIGSDTALIGHDLAPPFAPPFPLRLYAGQPDPKDASRFRIAYELQGHRGTITGVLNDDGSVWMTPDTGWHGRLDNIVSWEPKIPQPATKATSRAATR